MLQAMNTGHDGSMSTGHANSPKDMLARLETMVLMGTDMPLAAIKSQIAAGIDIMIHLARCSDKSRKVIEINEVLGYFEGDISLNRLYIRKQEELVKVGSLKNTEKLQNYGINL
jgi:pilus assembly protein CpaF